MKENDERISTSFYADAELKSDIEKIRKSLASFRVARKIYDNDSVLRYAIANGSSGETLLELAEGHISCRFFFLKQGYGTYRDNLLAFLSLIALLNDHYEVRLRSIYSYVVEALGDNWIDAANGQDRIDRLVERIEVMNDSNCALSAQIMDIHRENVLLTTNLEFYTKFVRDVLSGIRKNSTGLQGYRSALVRLDLDPDKVHQMESDCINKT